MDGMFSIEEISKELWSVNSPVSSSTNINRSSSEWTFERFLEETSPSDPRYSFRSPSSSLSSDNLAKNGGENIVEIMDTQIYPEEFQAVLKDFGSAPRTGILGKKLPKSILSVEKGSLALDTKKSWSKGLEFENGHLQTEKDVINGPIGAPDLFLVQRNSAVQARSTTSGSSRDQSDDEELEAEMENIETVGMTDIKRMRRMISNRESARRSRRRKQAHVTELETQVSQLNIEKSSLMKRLADISQKYNESSVDSRILKADVETLRAKVKMAEDSVKRVTGLSAPNLSSFNVPFSINPNVPANISVPVNENLNHFFQASQTRRNINDIASTFVPLSRMEDVLNTGGNLG